MAKIVYRQMPAPGQKLWCKSPRVGANFWCRSPGVCGGGVWLWMKLIPALSAWQPFVYFAVVASSLYRVVASSLYRVVASSLYRVGFPGRFPYFCKGEGTLKPTFLPSHEFFLCFFSYFCTRGLTYLHIYLLFLSSLFYFINLFKFIYCLFRQQKLIDEKPIDSILFHLSTT